MEENGYRELHSLAAAFEAACWRTVVPHSNGLCATNESFHHRPGVDRPYMIELEIKELTEGIATNRQRLREIFEIVSG